MWGVRLALSAYTRRRRRLRMRREESPHGLVPPMPELLCENGAEGLRIAER